MIVIGAVSDAIKAVLSAAKVTDDMDVVISERTITSTDYTPDRKVLNTNGTTQVTVVDGLLNSAHRKVVDNILFINLDTAPGLLTVSYVYSGDNYTLWKGWLMPQERLEYSDGLGWRVYDRYGAEKSADLEESPRTGVLNMIKLANNYINADFNNDNFCSINDLRFVVKSGKKYWFNFTFMFSLAASTTGQSWSVDTPPNTFFVQMCKYPSTATALIFANNAQTNVAAIATSSPAALVGISTVEGFCVPSSDGYITGRFKSELASTAVTCHAGSMAQWMEVA